MSRRFKSKVEGYRQAIKTWVCKVCLTPHTKSITGESGKPKQCYVCKQPQDYYYFASNAELKRWGQLRLRERMGFISELKTQERFYFYGTVNGTNQQFEDGYYTADFVYFENGLRVVEDVKGSRESIDRASLARIKRFERHYQEKVKIIIVK